jgi:hypothetical protein
MRRWRWTAVALAALLLGCRSLGPAQPTGAPVTPDGVAAQPASPSPTASEAIAAPDDLAATLALLPDLLARHPGDLQAVLAQLDAWGALETGGPDAPRAFSPLREGDLDGDGEAEALLLLVPPGAGGGELEAPRARALALLRRSGEGYVLAGSRTYEPAFQLDVTAHDLTRDGRPEAVVTYQDCGAHTCFLYVQVLAWDGKSLHDLLAVPATLSYADLRIEDLDGDGRDELALHGGAIGSVGAGPVETRTDLYAWDGQAIAPAGTAYDPSPFRLHALQDGDRALRQGDLQSALTAYRRAAADPALLPTGMQDEEEERLTLEAFAWYRLVAVHAMLGDRAAAVESLATLQHDYAGLPVAGLAAAFWEAYGANSDVAAGCAAARDYAAAHPEVLESFGDFGYGNPGYTADDLCPSP